MNDYRIIADRRTGSYKIQKKGWLVWKDLTEPVIYTGWQEDEPMLFYSPVEAVKWLLADLEARQVTRFSFNVIF